MDRSRAEKNALGLLRAPELIRSPTGIPLAALRVPLLMKLIGANVLIVATLLIGWESSGGPASSGRLAPILAGVVLAVSIGLTIIALRPIRDLEAVVSRVWRGDLGARVERSAVADNEVLRIGAMVNLLLDGLARDRARMKALAAEVIEVGDRERAALAHQLHDSTAQRLAALLMNISAVARDCRDPELAARLAAARDDAEDLTNEVRALAQAVHPRVLDDLGLGAALRKLARDASTRTGVDVDASVPGDITSLPRPVATVLYRVADEAVQNAVRHASPRHVRITVSTDRKAVWLEVRDDGEGFDYAAFEKQARGTGLRLIQDRLTVVEGALDVRTVPGGGTTLVATIPLQSEEAVAQPANEASG